MNDRFYLINVGRPSTDFGLLEYKQNAIIEACMRVNCNIRREGAAGYGLLRCLMQKKLATQNLLVNFSTPYFTAPELLRNETGPSKEADLYAFGIFMFEGLQSHILPVFSSFNNTKCSSSVQYFPGAILTSGKTRNQFLKR